MKVLLSTAMFAVCLLVNVNAGHSQESDLSNADGNSDGKVTVGEFKEYAASRLPGYEHLELFAKKVDADGNGEISAAEFDDRMNILQRLRDNPPTADDQGSDKKDPKPNAKDEAAAKKAYEAIKKLVGQNKWKEASQLMTKNGQNEISAETVISAIGMVNIDMPFPMPGMDEALEDIEDALTDHGLDKLDIETGSMFQMKFSIGDDEEDAEDLIEDLQSENDAAGKSEGDQEKKTPKQKRESTEAKIMKALDKNGKRWDVVADLWKAKRSLPFAMSPLNGEVENVEIEGDKAFLQIKMTPPPQPEERGGIIMQMKAPPVSIRLQKVDGGKWKMDGRDAKRTAAAMKEFMKNMPEPGLKRSKSDF